MSSVTEIVNNAYRLLGEGRINDLAEPTTLGQYARDVYEQTTADLLSRYAWNFAVKLSPPLGITTNVQVFEGEFAFNVPLDYLSVVDVLTESGQKIVSYEVRENTIISYCNVIRIKYVSRAEEYRFSAAFREALSYALASKLADLVKQSNTDGERFAIMAERQLSRARFHDSSEQHPIIRDDNVFIKSRSGYGVSQ